MCKNEIGPLPYTITKINSKLIKYLNRRPGTVNLLEENIGGKFHDNSAWQGFLGYDTKSTNNKAKLDKWDYIKLTKELLYSTGKNQE